MNSLIAELLLLRKRAAVWVLLAFWLGASLLFTYILPYVAFLRGLAFHRNVSGLVLLQLILPQNIVSNALNSVSFFGVVVVLILAVLSMGSEFSWGTLTPVFTQKASRTRIFFSKAGALAIALVPFVVLVFLLGLLFSLYVAWREGQTVLLPPLWDVVRALGAAWLIMAAWSAFGILISILSRGTALAIGLGIIYSLVVENVIAGFSSQIDFLLQISKGLLRTNGTALVAALGVSVQSGGGGGGGGFAGPSVPTLQAALVMTAYVVLFLGVSAYILRRRDVAGAG
ncbi:MAG: ABC transporter permease [Thermoleophilia bacterium]